MLKEKQDSEWVASLINYLIDSGINNKLHIYYPEDNIASFDKDYVYISKPSKEELDNLNIDLVIDNIKPKIKYLINILANNSR